MSWTAPVTAGIVPSLSNTLQNWIGIRKEPEPHLQGMRFNGLLSKNSLQVSNISDSRAFVICKPEPPIFHDDHIASNVYHIIAEWMVG